MEPIQKKCLLLSAVTHGLLLIALAVGAAFVKPPQQREIIPIKYISGKLVDSVLNGGGGAPRMVSVPNPNPQPGPAAPEPPAPTPPAPVPPAPRDPAPVTPPSTPPQPERHTAPPSPENNTAKKSKKSDLPTTTDTGKKSSVNTKLTTRSNPAEKSASGKTETTAKATKSGGAPNNKRMAALEKASANLKGLTSGGGLTVSDVLGDGVGGGPGAVNYSQAVLGAFDDAWNPPPELNEDRAIAVIKVVVHRTGRIVDARIIKRSNIHLMDFSVQSALEAVKSLPPFPEGARDLERTFTIEFNLKVKRGSG